MLMYFVFPAALLSAGRIGLPRWANMLLADIAPATDRRLPPSLLRAQEALRPQTPRRDPARLPLKISLSESLSRMYDWTRASRSAFVRALSFPPHRVRYTLAFAYRDLACAKKRPAAPAAGRSSDKVLRGR